MATKAKKRDGRGRPATGKDPGVGIRLPPELLRWVDQYAERNSLSRSAAMRQFAECARKKERAEPAE